MKYEGPLAAACTAKMFNEADALQEFKANDRHVKITTRGHNVFYRDATDAYWVEQFGSSSIAVDRYKKLKEEML